MTLTEQWKKGELEVDQYYYVKYADGSVEIQLYVGGFLMRTDNKVVEVLAPVPTYDEWQKMKEQRDACAWALDKIGDVLVQHNLVKK